MSLLPSRALARGSPLDLSLSRASHQSCVTPRLAFGPESSHREGESRRARSVHRERVVLRISCDLRAGTPQNGEGQPFVDLSMPWHGFFACSICPNVVISAVPQEVPAAFGKPSLKFAALHRSSVH